MSEHKPPPPSRTSEQYVLRFEENGMRDRLHEAARANGRSLNAELNARIRASFEGGADVSALRAELDLVRSRADQMTFVAEQYDAIRVMAAAMYLQVVEALPKDAKVPLVREPAMNMFREWISRPPSESPVRGLMEMIDSAGPEVRSGLSDLAAWVEQRSTHPPKYAALQEAARYAEGAATAPKKRARK